MIAATDFEIVRSYIPDVASLLGVDVAPPSLSRAQIAQVAGLKNAKVLAQTCYKELKKTNPPTRWIAFKAAVGGRTHRVPVERVARWIAMDRGMLPLPAGVAKDVAGEEPNTLESVIRRFHRCKD